MKHIDNKIYTEQKIKKNRADIINHKLLGWNRNVRHFFKKIISPFFCKSSEVYKSLVNIMTSKKKNSVRKKL